MSGRRARIAIRWAAVLAGIGLASTALLVVYGVALVDRAMAGRDQARSTRILGAPLLLESGSGWSSAELQLALARRGYRQVLGSNPGPGEMRVLAGAVVLRDGPGAPIALLPGRDGLRIEVDGFVRSAVELARPVIGARPVRGVVRWPVRLDEISPELITAVVDAEDRTFLSHPGLSLRGLLRATVRDLAAGGVREGGSTITQQLAKLLLLRPARTLPRKVLEAWLAALLEYRFDKRTILEAYLNRVYLGQDGGLQIQGVEAAAHVLFGRRASELTLDQAALLAGVIPAPNRFDPFDHPDAARARRDMVLTIMARAGHITPERLAELLARPLPERPNRLRWAPAAQFLEHVTAGSDDGEIATALDVDLQAAVHDGIRASLAGIEQRSARLRALAAEGDPLQAAAVLLAPDGRVLAMQGSRTGAPGELNRVLDARRQIGSLVKPWVVAAALESGWDLGAGLADEPLTVALSGGSWSPGNSDGRFRGEVTVERALVESLNVPIVRLGLGVGLDRVTDTLARVGLPAARHPSVLLGAFEAAPIDIACAYATLPGGGVRPVARFVDDRPAASGRALEPGIATAVLGALTAVPREGTAASLRGRVSGALACKTGTTDDRRDSWFAAVRPAVVAVVWVGTDANRPTGLTGALGALEVWQEIDARMPAVWRAGAFR